MAYTEQSDSYLGPCGIEPYDREWGVGVSAMVEDPSPFPRINRILKRYGQTMNGALEDERANLLT